MACHLHDERPAVSVCTTCDNMTICKGCESGKHHSHLIKKPSEVSANIKRDFKQQMENYIDLISKPESDKEDMSNRQEKQELSFRMVEKDINCQRKKLVGEVNRIADKLIVSYKETVKDNCKTLDSNTAKLQRHIDTTSRQKSEVNAILNERDDVLVVNMAKRIVSNNELDLNYLATVTDVTYNPGTIDVLQLDKMLGRSAPAAEDTKVSQRWTTAQTHVQTSHSDNSSLESASRVRSRRKKSSSFAKAKIKSDFQCSDDRFSKSYAFEIWPTGLNTSWLNFVNKKKLKLIDIKGITKETFRHDCMIRGVCATPGEDDLMFLCCDDEKCIKQLACIKEGSRLRLKLSDYLSTKPLRPQCVCRYQKKIHVTLVDSADLQITQESIRCLAAFENKNEVRRIEKDEFGDAIFVKPSRVKINKTGDMLAVINRTDKENSHLVLLNKDLTLKLRYLGDKTVLRNERFQSFMYSPDRPYTILDVEFTDENCLVVCELYSRCVQLLSADCQTLMTVIGQEAVVPYSVAYCKGNLWVGYFDGTVKVYEFK